MMKRILAALVALSLIICTGIAAYASDNDWKKIKHEVMSLYGQGRYQRAVVVAKEALRIAEQTHGPDHPNVATSLNNLAELYQAQGQYVQAEQLFRRALAINEKALGPDHPDVVRSLNNLAALYRTQRHYAPA